MPARLPIVLLIAIIFATGVYFGVRELEPKRDVLWLHFIGYQWFEPQRSTEALSGLTLSDPDDKLEVWRRDKMRWAYPLHAGSAYVGALVAARHRIMAIGVGLALPFLLGAGLFVAGAMRSREVEPLTIAAACFALSALVPGPSPTDHLLYYDSSIKNVTNALVLLLTPGGAFSPLSIQPKDTILLFAMAAFALRRSGARWVAYGLLASGALWHVHLTVVLLGLLALWDLVLARLMAKWFQHDEALLFSALCVGVAAACALIYLLGRGDSLWGVESAWIQLSTRMLLLAEAIVVGYAGFRAWHWLQNRIDPSTLSALFRTVGGFVAGVSVLAAVGMTWDRGRFASARISDPAVIESYGELAVYYDHALRQLTADQDRPRQ
jgi:hypothetical protein